MTLPSATNKWTYTGNGTTATYSYTKKIFVDTDLVLTVKDSDGNETTLTITTDYTVTGVGSVDGGTIVLVDSGQAWIDGSSYFETGWTLVIRRVRSIVQETDIRNGGAFYREAIEDEFDKQIMIDQQQQEQIDRSIKIAVTSSATPVLPEPVDGYVNQWDGTDGDMIAVPYSGDAISTAVTAAQAAQAAAELAETNAETAETNASGYADAAAASAAEIDLSSPNPIGDVTPNTGEFSTLKSASGATINEFSTDGTLAGNSDTAVPTEKAVKTYADALSLSVYVGSFTRDLTTATGTQAITGVGFTPKAVIFMGVVSATAKGGFGFMTSGEKALLSMNVDGTTDDYEATTAFVMKIYDTAGNFQTFIKSSLDADGFTLSWVKSGTPTGTVTINYLALK